MSIVATHLLESMMQQTYPHPSEIHDIALALQSLPDALMLSGETASGQHPLTAVKALAQLIVQVEGGPLPALAQMPPQGIICRSPQRAHELSTARIGPVFLATDNPPPHLGMMWGMHAVADLPFADLLKTLPCPYPLVVVNDTPQTLDLLGSFLPPR